MRWLVFIFMLLPSLAFSQGAATLIADSVTLNGQDQLIASGNVEVHYLGTSLTATRITYDRPSDQLIVEGPILIKAADGTLLVADQATMDPKLENGILQGARLVLDQQLQISANQINRTDGRYTQLYKTAATSCNVCGDQAPLWDIRAGRVVHDQAEQQLYFENATLRVRGVPVFWLPRMRLPDPTLDRATGFLVPRQRNNTQLGFGVKLPYFITLGDHRDITLTPYVSSETKTLELIYRQAFANGDLRIEGAISDDTLEAPTRSYVFVEGAFDFADSYHLDFDIEAVSDPAYLPDYGYSGKDRLDSAISLVRVTDTTLMQTNLTYYQTLRDDESNASLPPIVVELDYETRLHPAIGGTLTLGGGMDTIYRYSEVDGDAGRDMTRAGMRGDWRRDWVLDNGMVASTNANLRADLYAISDDSSYPASDLRLVPSAGVGLRWPLARQMANGSAHLIEPALAIAVTESYGTTAPNEDSTRAELDQANLLDAARFTGDDAVEIGTQAAAGVTWSRVGAMGTTTSLTFGRIFRDRPVDDFTPSSGLDGQHSDWLLSGQINTPFGFTFDGRSLFDDTDGLTRAASRFGWRDDDVTLAAAYIWQAADAIENRPNTVSEWTLDADMKLTEAWSVNLDARYDVAASRPVRAGIGVEWRNECVTFDVSASRRYTSSTTVEPTTNWGFGATLNGFSAGRAGGGPAARCSN